MKKYSLNSAWLLILVLLAACVAPSGDLTEKVELQLQSEINTLPGAVVNADGLLISYPQDNLFADGAVLPLPGGLEVLDPLIDLFDNNQKIRGVGVVRSSGHDDEYDLLLATKRVEILSRIFRNRGLTDDRMQLSAEVAAGAPFELQLQTIIPDTSEGVKR